MSERQRWLAGRGWLDDECILSANRVLVLLLTQFQHPAEQDATEDYPELDRKAKGLCLPFDSLERPEIGVVGEHPGAPTLSSDLQRLWPESSRIRHLG